jgi:hypothetical protein
MREGRRRDSVILLLLLFHISSFLSEENGKGRGELLINTILVFWLGYQVCIRAKGLMTCLHQIPAHSTIVCPLSAVVSSSSSSSGGGGGGGNASQADQSQGSNGRSRSHHYHHS